MKLAGAIYANLLLRDHVKLTFLGQDWGPPAELPLSVLISVMLVLFTWALVFTRPKLVVTWRQDDQRLAEQGPNPTVRFRESDGPTLCDIQVAYEQPRSALAALVTSKLRKHSPELLLDLEHETAIKLSRERQSETASGVKVKKKSVSFPLAAGNLGNSTASWALIGVKPARVPADLTVKCRYSLHFASKWLRFWGRWLPVEANVRAVCLVRII